MERLHQNLEDYRRQLESSTDRRLELSNYREMIGQREDEIRKQIDKIEVNHYVTTTYDGYPPPPN
jgi:small-conductance mechanosensitive channel